MPALVLRPTLTVEDLREFVRTHYENLSNHEREFFRELVRDRARGSTMVRLALGIDVAMHILGSVKGVPTTGRSVLGDEFFRARSDGIGFHYRVERFGEALFNLQGVPGFKDWLTDFPVVVQEAELAKALAGRFAEADAAGLMQQAGVLRALRPRTRKPNQDYDCDLLVDGVEVAAEIKAKVETTRLAPEILTRTVRHACNDQLPFEKPGIVWVSLPQTWIDAPTLQLNLDVAMIAIRDLPKPPLAVIVRWEEFEGIAVRLAFKMLPGSTNAREMSLANSLRQVLATSYGSRTWVRFASIVEESLPAY
jgi:hypothetical protein